MSTAIAELVHAHHRRPSVPDYHRMEEAGILREDDRVELIEGAIIELAPIGSRHASIVARLTRILTDAIDDRAIVWPQNPIVLGGRSEPQPDIAVLRPREDYYAASLPLAEHVLLIVEVSESSPSYDREVKLPLYARHGIPEGWLVDIEARALHTFREPSERGYAQKILPDERLLKGLAPLQLPDVTLDLSELLAGP